jgi:hypothetical protein
MFVPASPSIGAIMSEPVGLFDGLRQITELMDAESCTWDEAVERLREPVSNVIHVDFRRPRELDQ